MTDVTVSPEILAAVQAAIEQFMSQPPTQAAPAAAQATGLGLTRKSTAPAAAIHGISVPVKLDMDDGSLRVYVWLGPEAAATTEAFQDALDGVEQQIGPLDIWSGGSKSGGLTGGRGSYRKRGR